MHLLNSDWFSDPTKNDSFEIASLVNVLKLFYLSLIGQSISVLNGLSGSAWYNLLFVRIWSSHNREKISYNESFRNMTHGISKCDNVTRLSDTSHVTLTIENVPWINWHSVSTVLKIEIFNLLSKFRISVDKNH